MAPAVFSQKKPVPIYKNPARSQVEAGELELHAAIVFKSIKQVKTIGVK